MAQIKEKGLMTKLKPLACPECGGEIFRKYFASIPGFFSFDVTGKNPEGRIEFTYEVCVGCGWQSQSLDIEEMRERTVNMLRGLYDDSKCFKEAPYDPSSRGQTQ